MSRKTIAFLNLLLRDPALADKMPLTFGMTTTFACMSSAQVDPGSIGAFFFTLIQELFWHSFQQ